MATMMKERQINADFDRDADVLYLALGRPRPDEGEDKDDGIVLRYGVPDDRPSGVTVIGYVKFGWSARVSDLAEIASNHLSVKPAEVIASIRSAEGRT